MSWRVEGLVGSPVDDPAERVAEEGEVAGERNHDITIVLRDREQVERGHDKALGKRGGCSVCVCAYVSLESSATALANHDMLLPSMKTISCHTT